MPLKYEAKVRLTLIETDGTEAVHFLRGNISVAEVLRRFGYVKVKHKRILLSRQELLKELADEYGLTLHVS